MKAGACKGREGEEPKETRWAKSEVTLHFQITNSYKPWKRLNQSSLLGLNLMPCPQNHHHSAIRDTGERMTRKRWTNNCKHLSFLGQVPLSPKAVSTPLSFLSPRVIMRTWGLNVQRAFWAPTGNSIIELYKQGAFKVLNPKKFNNIHKHRFKWKTWKAKNVCYINTALVDCNKVLI